jgi:F-type H+-transporting ATPase subunit b
VLASFLVLASAETTELLDQAAEEVKNPILPTLNEMFWAALFFILLWILMKYVLLPRVAGAMDERAERVRGDLAAAESAEAERVAKLQQYEAGLAGARAEAMAIIDASRAEADVERRAQLASAESDVAAMKAEAAAEVAEAKARARVELTGSITDIAVGAASAVVGKEIDRAAQTRIVEEHVNSSGRN